jgi:hypothetical protein
MPRILIVAAAVLLAALGPTASLEAQAWRPSTRQMPAMPAIGELAGDWLGARAVWFNGVAAISGVEPGALQAVGEAGRGDAKARVVRFNSGPLPVVVWQDRNGDGRADLVEIYRSGGLIIQVIDADYDGQANVVRTYDATGALIREDRL